MNADRFLAICAACAAVAVLALAAWYAGHPSASANSTVLAYVGLCCLAGAVLIDRIGGSS